MKQPPDKQTFMHSFLCLVLFLFLYPAILCRAQEPFRVMFWNVENLFDTRDDSLKNDNEFLPDATRRWTRSRYRQKLTNLAKGIIASSHKERIPDLVGLCEVENDSCLYDLTHRSPLREADYRYVMTDSPDERGIDVALLYQHRSFKLLQHQSIRIPHTQMKRPPTRDILHVTGQVVSGDTLDVWVCHFPSRSQGKAASEPFRMLAARTLRQSIDSLMQIRRHPYFIIMGDFNDQHSDKSLRIEICGKGDLHNLMIHRGKGTYRYRGEWETFDQFIVSSTLTEGKDCNIHLKGVQIFQHPFLLEEDTNNGGYKPFRTFNGIRYQGGYSDHLPIGLDLEIEYISATQEDFPAPY